MEQNPIANELDLFPGIDDANDFVQILGVTPSEDDEEIEVTSIEFDGGESFFIDVDEEPLLSEEDHQEMISINEEDSIEDTFDSNDYADGANAL